MSASSDVIAGLWGSIQVGINVPCGLCGGGVSENSIGVAAAVGAAFVQLSNFTCRSTVSVDVTGSAGANATSLAEKVVTEAVVLLVDCATSGVSADCVSYWSCAQGTLDGGLDPNDSMTLSLTPCSGSSDAHVMFVAFDPDQMDVNGDGRFNDADAAALEAELNSTDEDLLFKFDFDGSGDIDEDDVAVLNALVFCDLGHGVFADLDGDGDVDFFDTQAYLADYAAEEPAADLNGDETWNYFDVQAYLGYYSAPCS